jgi:hypothetical protein
MCGGFIWSWSQTVIPAFSHNLRWLKCATVLSGRSDGHLHLHGQRSARENVREENVRGECARNQTLSCYPAKFLLSRLQDCARFATVGLLYVCHPLRTLYKHFFVCCTVCELTRKSHDMVWKTNKVLQKNPSVLTEGRT